MDFFFTDLNYLASDLVTGKSLPILIAASTIPLDPNLMGTMIIAGVLIGSGAILIQAWQPPKTNILVDWGIRFVNHLFSAFLSAAFMFRLANQIHPGSGGAISVLPAFCVILQHVQERPSTPFTLLALSIALFWAGIFYEFGKEDEHPHHTIVADHQQMLSRSLLAMSRGDWLKKRTKEMYKADTGVVQTVWDSTRYSLVILILTIYATVQHGPIHTYTQTDTRKYLSIQFICNKGYSLWPTLSAAMLRAYVYLRTAWLHGNALHLMCEDRELISTACAWLHMVVLLYSMAWNGTQLTEQGLTGFVGDKVDMRMRLTGAMLSFAYIYRWRDEWMGFWLTIGLTGALASAWIFGRLRGY